MGFPVPGSSESQHRRKVLILLLFVSFGHLGCPDTGFGMGISPWLGSQKGQKGTILTEKTSLGGPVAGFRHV